MRYVAIGAAALAAFLVGFSCYTGNPDWPYDPTQPAGPFPRRNQVLPVYDAGADSATPAVHDRLPPLPLNPPRFNVWCNR